jgi:uncharacterized phage protein (TIGR02216 family)
MKLSPAVFWSLSLAEWRALTAPCAGNAPLVRRELETMMQQYPDRP